jgi:hypothetical protein
MERAEAEVYAHTRMSEDGCPHPTPQVVFKKLNVTFEQYLENWRD